MVFFLEPDLMLVPLLFAEFLLAESLRKVFSAQMRIKTAMPINMSVKILPGSFMKMSIYFQKDLSQVS